MIVATESPRRLRRRASISVSSTPRPASTSSSTAPVSIVHTSRRAGSVSRTSATVAVCPPVSAKTATAPESDRIHDTCSADDVS